MPWIERNENIWNISVVIFDSKQLGYACYFLETTLASKTNFIA